MNLKADRILTGGDPGRTVQRVSTWTVLLSVALAACSNLAPTDPTPIPGRATLTLYNWSEDFPQSVQDRFTAETGIAVDYQVYDSMEEAVASLESGGAYDVVNLDNRFIPALIEQGLLAELDQSYLPNLKNISPDFRDLVYDPGNRYTVPYNWGTTGLVIRRGLADRSVAKWSDLWDPHWAGRVALLQGQPREVLGLTLKSLGYSANTEDPVELATALTRLTELKPHVIWLDGDINSLASRLESGEIVFGMGYAGDVVLARETMPDVAYVLPEEGTLLWGENFVIPATSPHRELAERFLNFVLRPEIAAQIANENFYATPNEAAYALIAPEIRNDPVIFPPNDVLHNAEIVLPLTPVGQALYEKTWEAFLATTEP